MIGVLQTRKDSQKDEGKSVALYLDYVAASGQSLGKMDSTFVVHGSQESDQMLDITRFVHGVGFSGLEQVDRRRVNAGRITLFLNLVCAVASIQAFEFPMDPFIGQVEAHN
jgi:hypothetical protein